MSTAEKAVTQLIQSQSGVRHAYRRFGQPGDVPIVLHIHFRGNMDFWDPQLVNFLAQNREVILSDTAGVGLSTGSVPPTFAGWAADMIAFIKALGLEKVDLFGFSMGGLAVLEAALAAPSLVRKLVIAGSRASVPAQGPVPGIVWPQDEGPAEYITRLASAVTLAEGRDALKYSCFQHTTAGATAFDTYWKRVSSRTAEEPKLELLPMAPNGSKQVAAVVNASTPQPGGSFDPLGDLKMPVLVMNGDDDVLVPTSRSWELLKRIENAQLIIYPRSGHGFLWQYATRVAEDTNRFLDGLESGSEVVTV